MPKAMNFGLIVEILIQPPTTCSSDDDDWS